MSEKQKEKIALQRTIIAVLLIFVVFILVVCVVMANTANDIAEVVATGVAGTPTRVP